MRIFMFLGVAFSIVTLMVALGCNPGTEDGNTTTLEFQCEYDHANECNIFPDGSYTWVGDAFDDANTNFSAYFSDVSLTAPVIATDQELRTLRDDFAEHVDGNRRYPLYLVSVPRWGSGGKLGTTLEGGQKYSAICAIFYDDISDKAETINVSETKLRKYAVVHELGHGRDRLTHLCRWEAQHESPEIGFTGAMSEYYVAGTGCLEEDDRPPWEGNPHFCTKCDERLKQVASWEVRL